MYQRWKLKVLSKWSHLVALHPRFVLTGVALSVVLCLWVTLLGVHVPGYGPVGPLGFQSNRNDLISPKLDWNQRFIGWQRGFPGTWDFIIVVDVGDDDAARVQRVKSATAMIDELGPALQKNQWVKRAVWGFDSSSVSPKAVRLETLDESKPADDFRFWLEEMRSSTTLIASSSPQAFLAGVLGQLQQTEKAEDADESQAIAGLRQFRAMLSAFNTALVNDTDQPTDLDKLIRESQPAAWNYFVSDNGRLYFMRVTPKHDEGSLNALAPAINAVRDVMREIESKHPGVVMGLTGIDVVETDETAVVDFDSTWTGALTGLCMFGLLVMAFHSWRTPLMIMLSLSVAIIWSFGFATIFVGHLQVISIVFIPLLLGLGIAYGIYLASRFELVRHQYSDDVGGYTQAMADVFTTMGPGILTGCVTTAAAFIMTLFTDFTGVAEMGLIASVGVMLCLVSMGTTYPALVRIIKPSHRHVKPMTDRFVHLYEDRWFTPFANHPRLTLSVAALLTLGSLISVYWMKFDYNLLKLQAAGMDSVEWERKIVEDGGESIWFGVSIVHDMDQARKLTAEYRKQPTVGLVRGVGLLIPENENRKVELLTQVRDEIEAAATRAEQATHAQIPGAGVGLEFQLALLNLAFQTQAKRGDIPAAVQPHIEKVGEALKQLTGSLAAMSLDTKTKRLARLQNEFTDWRLNTLRLLREATDPTPMGLHDLPPEILEPYRGTLAGKPVLALEIFPAAIDVRTGAATSALDPNFLRRFISDMRSVDQTVTGVIVQIYESGTLIQRSYVFAGALALVAVLILVWLDFGNGRDALLSLVPVVVGFALTFGIMKLWGMKINPANVVVLPLMFGIGIDSGVHMIYRWRMDKTGLPPGLTQGTGKGIVIVNLATLVGFGGMMLARHRGMQSLGFVLTLGMAMTLLACLTVMPAWLSLRKKR